MVMARSSHGAPQRFRTKRWLAATRSGSAPPAGRTEPPHRYVSGKRLARAKVLLIQDDRSLVEIALALGFSSQANFTRAFKLATGLAPGQFRNGSGSRQRDL
ncbi:helix-turn-helix domain-containing protein [Bradyrhizobium sp. AS23.2]|uniref:helix-turn-helix domain-containing protein n=1 Tax=Bradyrhizobium sp. AS23.2 TaxID=1680155 RepID=UPI00093F8A7A